MFYFFSEYLRLNIYQISFCWLTLAVNKHGVALFYWKSCLSVAVKCFTGIFQFNDYVETRIQILEGHIMITRLFCPGSKTACLIPLNIQKYFHKNEKTFTNKWDVLFLSNIVVFYSFHFRLPVLHLST